MNHAPKYLTKAQQNFQMSETFARNGEGDMCQVCKRPVRVSNESPCAGCGFPSPPQPTPEPGIVRGSFTLRREGAAYSGTLTLHGFHYRLSAEVAEDAQGKHFSGAAFDDMTRQLCEIPFTDLPAVARDPRLNATQQEMITAIHETFRETPPREGN